MTFTQYLEQKKFSAKTVNTYSFYIRRFLTWLESENLTVEHFTYTELLDFMGYCQARGITNRTVGNMLGIIRHYCNYLIAEGRRTTNPAAGVFIKGMVRKLPANLLSMEELEELYKQYSLQLHVGASKKIMLGLMVYQGLTVTELTRIQAQDIRLKEGKIRIRGTKRTHERILALNGNQMMDMQQYLNENKFKQEKLFVEPSKKGTSQHNISNRVQYMFGQLKQLNPKAINAKQIRSSVITHWLRQNNLRQVQYMAGHKYVSSTERYQVNNLEDLENELQQHHPMK